MVPIEVIQDTQHQHMYRIKYDDGVISEEMYNLSRANQVLQFYDLLLENQRKQEETEVEIANRMPRSPPRKAVRAFKSKKGIEVAGD